MSSCRSHQQSHWVTGGEVDGIGPRQAQLSPHHRRLASNVPKHTAQASLSILLEGSNTCGIITCGITTYGMFCHRIPDNLWSDNLPQ